MYKIRKMKFKSIIKNGEETSTVEFEGNGTIREADGMIAYYLDYGKEHYEFIFKGDQLTLKQSKSSLHMIENQKVDNVYRTAYGVMPLTCLLEKKEIKDTGIRIVYNLYQDQELLSRVYMMIIYA